MEARDTRSFFERPWLPELALVIGTVVLYLTAISNGFVFFDDDKAIVYNTLLQQSSLSKFFTGENLGMYAPLTWLMYGAGYSISKLEPWGYHALSVAFHALNAVLAFTVLRRLTGLAWPAFFAALLFAFHPIQVEPVAWAAGLSTLVFSACYLASLDAYVRWVKTGASMRSISYWLCLFLFLLACLAKSAAVTLPLVLIAVDFYFFKNPSRKLWLSKLPFLAISLVLGLYTFTTRAHEGHDIETASRVFGATDRFFMVCQTLLFYPVKLLLPLSFSVNYPFVKPGGAWTWDYYVAPLVLAAIGYSAWRFWCSRPNLLLGLALYFLPLTVMLPFRTVGSFELRSDRYAYLSCLGLFFVAGIFLEKTGPLLRNSLMILVALLFGALTLKQIGVWKNGITLFENCVRKTPESSLCQCNLAYSELLSYKFENAVLHYTEGLRYDSNAVEAYNGRGQAYFNLKKVPEALSDFNNAISSGLSSPKLFFNRGRCLVILGRPQDAIPDLSRSIELEPKSPDTWFYRASAYEKSGNAEAALKDYSEAVRLEPKYFQAYVNRGFLQFNLGHFEEAINDYGAALPYAPANVQPMVLNNRAGAFLKLGKPEEALADLNKALEISPNYAKGYETRAQVYQLLGQPERAQADLAKIKK